MLILPIVNRNRVLNVEIKLKNSEKVKTGVYLEDTRESEVVVNGKKFTDSSYHLDIGNESSVVDFIRNASIINKGDYFITTRENSKSKLYDVYSVSHPNKKVHPSLDNLYASVVTDMRKEIPDIKRGRYLSLEKMGLDEHLTDEKIEKLQEIVREEKDQSRWPLLFKQANISDLVDTIDFVNMFDCTVISDTTIPEDVLEATINALRPLNTKDYRNLNSYYDMAQENKRIYSKLSIINKTIYNRPYTLIQTKAQKQKQLIKTMDDKSRAA